MILMVCVDDDMGMMFNKRRQSQDKALREHILKMTAENRLWMNRYSAQQFDNAPQIIVHENFPAEAKAGDFCLAENRDVSPYEPMAEKIIIFKWNRRYPSDLRFNIDLSSWRLIAINEFPGFSHEKITEEVYVK